MVDSPLFVAVCPGIMCYMPELVVCTSGEEPMEPIGL